MVRNLSAYCILYVIKIKVKVCPEKLNFLVCHKDQVWAQSRFHETSPLLKRQSNKIDCIKIFQRVAKSWSPAIQGWPLPPHGHRPVSS